MYDLGGGNSTLALLKIEGLKATRVQTNSEASQAFAGYDGDGGSLEPAR